MEKEVGSNSPVAAAAAGWANWAVGAVTAKFYKSRYCPSLFVPLTHYKIKKYNWKKSEKSD